MDNLSISDDEKGDYGTVFWMPCSAYEVDQFYSTEKK